MQSYCFFTKKKLVQHTCAREIEYILHHAKNRQKGIFNMVTGKDAAGLGKEWSTNENIIPCALGFEVNS